MTSLNLDLLNELRIMSSDVQSIARHLPELPGESFDAAPVMQRLAERLDLLVQLARQSGLPAVTLVVPGEDDDGLEEHPSDPRRADGHRQESRAVHHLAGADRQECQRLRDLSRSRAAASSQARSAYRRGRKSVRRKRTRRK